MLRNLYYARSLDESLDATPSVPPAQPTAAASWRAAAAALRMLCDAWRESLAAHRQYEHLRSRGHLHDAALRDALGVGQGRSEPTGKAAKPLCFAGRA